MINRLIGVVVILILFAMAMSLSKAHDWYPPECCSNKDCEPVKAHAVQGGYMIDATGEVVPYNKARPSMDDGFHQCLVGGYRLCFFAPISGS